MERKYYWLKLKNDFFATKEMKKLRKIAGGDTYTIIYLKLQLLSLKDEGKLFYDGIEESFAEELALTIDEDADNVKATLLFLEKCGLVELNGTELFMCNVPSCIGSETGAAERMRELRRNRVEQSANKVTQKRNKVQTCYTEIDIEKEKDIETEKELEPEKKKKTPAAALESILADSGLTEEVKEAFKDFVDMRKTIKSPMTEKAIKLMLGKLIKMTDRTDERVAIINQSVENGWKGLYPLKTEGKTRGEREQDKTVDMLNDWMKEDYGKSGIF